MSGFQDVLSKFRKHAFSERDKGARFERLIQAYLKTDPKFSFAKVWLWPNFPYRKDFGGGGDVGIDLVALTDRGEYWAIQCKCYQEDSYINKEAVDTFLAASGKRFRDDKLQGVNFAHRLWVSTTNKWSGNAEESLRNQTPPVSRLNLSDLENAGVDWKNLEAGICGGKALAPPKHPFPHQTEAINKAAEYYKTNERGKLIMACGTGKTFTALKIAEQETGGQGLVLFLAPSIALLGQILNEWCAQAEEKINPICICSDAEVSKKATPNEDGGISIVDLALPATTNVKQIVYQLEEKKKGLTVVFSTYQSIEVIARAQKALSKDRIFDLIVCDEAHRTTGVTLAGDEESAFVKVHDNGFLKAKKRLYMTATPRLYSDSSKSKAEQYNAALCSMDDPKLYGGEIYRIGFGAAVEQNLLSDYKVLILTVNDSAVPAELRKMAASGGSEINADDAAKLVGCINALSKRILGDEGILKKTDPEPMRRAVSFCQNIKISKKTADLFNNTQDIYYKALDAKSRAEVVSVEAKHMDGKMGAGERNEKLLWLKSNPDNERECRMLCNVRVLSEGVDVPSLDAVLFLSAKNSQVDVVQSVGRVMRKSEGKRYGYIIIPVVAPANVPPEEALNDNKRYAVVWTVLNALRAHDDRFNAVANKIDLNKKAGGPIIIGAPPVIGGAGGAEPPSAMSLPFPWEDYKDALLARMVLKVGDRLYWEQWAKDVARIAERHIERIGRLARTDGKHQKVFADFLAGLRRNINPGITASSAIEMLAQHLITQPIFEALFENYSFAKNNPISRSMQKMLTLLEKQALDKDAETLRKFYDSVRKRVEGITSAQGRQKIVIELYEKFFKTAFPKQVEKLGIVYTPVECVDFIIKSVACLLKKEFNRNISDENVHILDPFTGTGTFIVRLLQNGLISRPDLPRKYAKELHANEIILLAYYIASVNIENAYHDIIKSAEYKAFDGICLTDTFQLGETDRSEALISEIFPENSARVKKQKNAPIKIIIGNPPYSVGQESANDNAQNENYPKLEKRIAETYVARTDATNKNSIYDTYIKAFRWSADRLDKEGGIIAFISNSGWLDGNSADGFRKCLEEEFSAIYVFNLRGNQRTSGELSRREGGKIFGGGSRTPISITFLIKNPEAKNKKAEIYYYDIGDYLDRIEKLNIIKNFGDMEKIKWQKITPNQHGDWLNQRNDKFKTFIPLEAAKKFDTATQTIFTLNSRGFETARDMWVYNFSKKSVQNNIKLMIDNYNEQVTQYKYELEVKKNTRIKLESFINTDKRKISWTSSLLDNLCRLNAVRYEEEKITIGLYRPFCKSFVYYGEKIIHRRGQFPELFPGGNAENLVICVSGIGGSKENSVFIANIIPDLNCLDAGTQCFPLYWYEGKAKIALGLFDNPASDKEYIRRDAVSDFILAQAKKIYGGSAAKEDIFYYVYGFLHSPDYRRIFSADLKKDLPHIPLLDEPAQFWAFSKAGRQLAELHLDYEYQGKPDGVIVCGDSPRARSEIYEVQKMRFPAKDKKDAIIYNSHITIENIPPEVYEYAVNGRSPVEWIMERYRVSADKDSGIKNDPNDWSRENNNPRYILDLLLSAMTVSLRTREIIKGLPAVRF